MKKMVFKVNKVVPFLLVVAIFAVIFGIFWYQEYQYALPTPVPEDFEEVPISHSVDLSKEKISQNAFIHFFNSDCPCSRFNLTHFNEIVKKYHSKIDFYVVVENALDAEDLKIMSRNVAEQAKRLLDIDKSLAKKLGVYSSPQAVILKNGTIFYRGNYNKSRFCTNKNTNYAQMALDSLLAGKRTFSAEPQAYKSYGCQLPKYSSQ